jgi:proline dehydrogenase
VILRRLLLRASEQRWLGEQARRRRFTRRAVERFMPGEALEDALAASAKLRDAGIRSVFHELGENVATASEAEAATSAYTEALSRAADAALDPHVSVKLSHLGLDVDPELARRNLSALVSAAESRGGLVWMDMESSTYADRTLALFREARGASPAVGLCLQAYLRRTADDLESLIAMGPWLRLVKGAYDEPARIAYSRRAEVDANFLSLAARLMQPDARRAGARFAAATHDTALIGRIAERARGAGMARADYELQMLYGIKRDEQGGLARAGHQVRVLISYGSDWYPWFVRRLAERPANLIFVLRNLV